MGLTVAPIGAWFFAWFSLVPLWVFIVTPSSPPLLLSLVWGIGYYGTALSWITGIHPMTWMGVPWLASLLIALFCWVFITLWGTALVATWAIGMRTILDFRMTILDWVWRAFQQKSWKSTKNIIIPNPKSVLESLPQNEIQARQLAQRGEPHCQSHISGKPPAALALPATGSSFCKIKNGLIRVLIGTALWCGLEAIWSCGPLWWSTLAYTQSPHNLAILHLGQFSGASTVTAAIVAVNGLLAEAWINRKGMFAKSDKGMERKISSVSLLKSNKYLPLAIILLITLHLIGFGLYARPLAQPVGAALKVGIVQGNVPNQIKLYPEGFRRALEGYTRGYLSLANQGVTAVLTPEGALPFSQSNIMHSSLVDAVREFGVVAWVGGFYKEGNSYTNSLFTVLGNGKIMNHYGKAKLVPIGEYIPFEQILGAIVKRLSPLDEHQVPGSPNQVFDTPFGRAIVGICYESAFPEHFRYQAAAGGQFILSPSNDAHFSAAMPAQHHAQDTMRAIETDRWAVRATNTGYSAFVDPHGKTLWISLHDTYVVHAETIYRRQTQTLYVRWGDWLTPLLLILSAFFLVLEYLQSRMMTNSSFENKIEDANHPQILWRL
ncbi:MAG: apolipoprotein N-acyltransferase [Rhizonema sp. PD37]|nr:apolipoprotein N-acyltransferase [Rhizonema sp. PD37]